jgi:hypothetical protein
MHKHAQTNQHDTGDKVQYRRTIPGVKMEKRACISEKANGRRLTEGRMKNPGYRIIYMLLCFFSFSLALVIILSN